ncbi:MAG: hypothetical protein M3Y21_01615 [Candidatus Eremiobacteraeota bacterium]|nr:hypothetical protein [Candidatus Eremiobacteraeota bacterium]
MNAYAKAALLGAATGMRTSAGPLAVAWNKSDSRPMRNLFAFGAEVCADKLPFIGSRTRVGGLAARAGSAIYAARSSSESSPGTLAVAAAAAIGTAFLAKRVRLALAKRTRIPQQIIGIAEDALTLGLVYVISLDNRRS